MTQDVLISEGDVLTGEDWIADGAVVGLPSPDEMVCATDPFDDFDDDDFDDEFDDDFEEEWDDELPGEDDLPDPDQAGDEEEGAPFDDDAEFDE